MSSPLKAATAVFLLGLMPASAAVLHEQGFESGLSSPTWTTGGTVDGRAVVTSAHGPATGNSHLVLDDATTDATFSTAEATLKLDLSYKKTVVLTFKAKSLGNEPHIPPSTNFTTTRNYDGVAISADGGTTWRSVQSLANVDTNWEAFVVPLDAAVTSLAGSYWQNFLIRFSAYDNSEAPLDGIAIDDLSVTGIDDQRVVLEMPAVVAEGSGPHTGYALLSFPTTAPVTVSFATSPAGQLTLPDVTIPQGEIFAAFNFTAEDDALVNMTRTITVTPSGAGVTGVAGSVKISDNEAPPLAVLNLPVSVTEGISASSNAGITLDFPATAPIIFSLAASPAAEVTVPATVTVTAGQTFASFTITAVNDTVLDGNTPVTITATATGMAPASGQLTAIDNEIPTLSWTLPASIAEGSSGSGTVTLSSPLATNLDVFLTSSASGTLAVPVKVVIPAGQTSAVVALTAGNDSLVNLARTVTLIATGNGVSTGNKTIVVDDDELPPALTVTLPAQLTEGASASSGMVSISSPAAVGIVVTLASTPTSELTHSSLVSITAGLTSATFTVSATNDTRIDGNLTATLTASAAGLASATTQCVAVDNDARVLSLTMPASIQEGTSANATVKIPGTLTTPLTVELASSLPGSLVVPSSVAIAAGQTQATFSMTAASNDLKDGTHQVTVSASAATFTPGSTSVPVKDDDVAGYRFSSLTDLVAAGVPLAVTISAADVEGNLIPGLVNSVALDLVAADGTSQPVSPSGVVLSGSSGWSGSLTLPAMSTAPAPFRLRATDPSGVTSTSTPFDLIQTLALKTADLVWDGTRGRIYASVPATAPSPYNNQVVAIDPQTLQVTASVATHQDPGQMVITSGDEYLYVYLKANGTITRIDLATMTVLSTFAIGTDPSYGTISASDICAVAGQPDLVVVSQRLASISPSHFGVAVFENGVRRQSKSPSDFGSDIIEPSADSTVFFGLHTSTSVAGFRRLILSANGISQVGVQDGLLSGDPTMKSSGNRVYSSTGIALDGQIFRKAGTFGTSGVVCPDGGTNRVFFMELATSSSTNYNKIAAYDPASFGLLKRLTMPSYVSPGTLIRWGANGMAFRTSDLIGAFRSSTLVPVGAPADLVSTVQASPNPALPGAPLSYTVTVTNNGPNAAAATTVTATLSDGQALPTSTSDKGTPVAAGFVHTLAIASLAAGDSATLTLVTTPLSAGTLSCTASVASHAADPAPVNNAAFKLVSVGFNPAGDSVNFLRLSASNLVNDPSRGVFWASIPETVEAPLGRSVVSINPVSGLISDPVPLYAVPAPGTMTLSANGRYLYVGLSDVPEIARLDLSVSPPDILRVPLGMDNWGKFGTAKDIEVLEGDGTSILVTNQGDDAAMVIDGITRRTTRTGTYTVSRVEKSTTPGVYIGYNAATTYGLTRLSVTASGVTILQEVQDVVTGQQDIRASGNLLLSSSGRLVDLNTLALKWNLGVQGAPCIDSVYQRAYIVNGANLRTFDCATGAAAGTIALPTTATGSTWASNCIRWGIDGLAFTGNDGRVYIVRSSFAMPASLDSDVDGIPNVWAAAYFGTPDVGAGDSDNDGIRDRIEYLFGTSPVASSANPLSVAASPPQGGETVTHLYFTRRAGISRPAYAYEASENMTGWTAAPAVVETILSNETIDGVLVERIDAAITLPWTGQGFVRIRWK